MRIIINATIVSALLLTGCGDSSIPNAELIAASLNQHWFELEIPAEVDGLICLQTSSTDEVLTSGGVTCPKLGVYPVMIQKNDDNSFTWYLKTDSGSARGDSNSLVGKTFGISAISGKQRITLGEPVFCLGTNEASIDVLPEGAYHIAFNVVASNN